MFKTLILISKTYHKFLYLCEESQRSYLILYDIKVQLNVNLTNA